MATHELSCGCACGQVHPIDVLRQEHDVILGVLAAGEAELLRMHDRVPLRNTFWWQWLEFLEHYADRCHHGKEEDVLFARLDQLAGWHGMGPTHCMRREHESMRAGRARLAEILTSDDREALVTAIRSSIDDLRAHIGKENEILFPMARNMLAAADVHELRRGFACIEKEVMGEGSHCRYEHLAQELCQQAPAAG